MFLLVPKYVIEEGSTCLKEKVIWVNLDYIMRILNFSHSKLVLFCRKLEAVVSSLILLEKGRTYFQYRQCPLPSPILLFKITAHIHIV